MVFIIAHRMNVGEGLKNWIDFIQLLTLCITIVVYLKLDSISSKVIFAAGVLGMGVALFIALPRALGL